MALDRAPEYPAFREVSMDDRDWITRLFDQYPTEISERTFGSIFIWRDYEDRSLLSRFEDHLLISWRKEKFGRMILAPVGPGPAEVIQKLTSPALLPVLAFNGVFGIVEPLAADLRPKGFNPQSVRDEWDYIYLKDDLVKLVGPKYHTQRKEMKKAASSLKREYLPMSSELRDQCLELQETWCDIKHCTNDNLSEAEDVALKEALLNYDSLGFIGGVVTVDGKVQALSIGEKLNSETAVVHFEKANPDMRGLYQVINQQFCEHALEGFKFVNREQDVGEPGLRRAKEGYHPHHFVEKQILPFK